MIPHRMLGNGFSSSVLKNRVNACRKRLRESRVMLRTHGADGSEDLFSQSARTMSPDHGHNSPFDGGDPDNCRLLRIDEEEVGIT
jgi:hypothetical protein